MQKNEYDNDCAKSTHVKNKPPRKKDIHKFNRQR